MHEEVSLLKWGKFFVIEKHCNEEFSTKPDQYVRKWGISSETNTLVSSGTV